MKTTFGRQFGATVMILLLALLLLGGAFRVLTAEYLKENTTSQLLADAGAIAEITAAYSADDRLYDELLQTNLTLVAQVSDSDVVAEGQRILFCIFTFAYQKMLYERTEQ